MRFVTFGEEHYSGFNSIMQKSILVPAEKYQRLLERSATYNKVETRDSGTETDHQSAEGEPETQIKTEEKTEGAESQETSLSGGEPIKVSESFRALESVEKPVKKRKPCSRPPGIRDYKSMWIKLNGRL